MITARNLRTLAVVFGLGIGCVRLNEPEHFVCNADADCEDDQKCGYSYDRCVAKDYCDSNISCTEGQHCAAQRCVVDECSSTTEAQSCNGYDCQSGVCRTSCGYSADCANGFHCELAKCVPGSPLDIGSACKQDYECQSGTCCQKPSGALCASSCEDVPDDSCAAAEDCLSRNCCKRPGGKYACSTLPCASVPECASDSDCASDESCQNEKCSERPPLKLNGETCKVGTDCRSGSCFKEVCRGTADYADPCKVDSDCTARRVCCQSPSDDDKKTCSDLDRGCAGSIGDGCEFDFQCVENDCNGSYTGFCTKPCATNAECGVSPWGVPNVCETNGLGKMICFPGCTESKECWDNVSTSLACYDAYDSYAKICADE